MAEGAEGTEGRLPIVRRDKRYLAVNKPAGLRSVPAFKAPEEPAPGSRKRKRQERWSDVLASISEADVETSLKPLVGKLASEALNVPRKRNKFFSYAKRSLRVQDDLVIESLWKAIEKRVATQEDEEGFTSTDSILSRVQNAVAESAVAVHRLDCETSGIMLIALDPATAEELNRQFRAREVQKRYVAVVHGRVTDPTGRITLPLSADPADRPRQVVDHENGKQSETTWKVLERQENRTRLELHPVTGRTHQLRVHLQGSGHPIVGDSLYCADPTTADEPRLLLHAEQISFTDPSTSERVVLQADCPF